MSEFVGSETLIDVPCPSCGNTMQETFGRIQDKVQITCSGCNSPITVDGSDLRAVIEALDRDVIADRQKKIKIDIKL